MRRVFAIVLAACGEVATPEVDASFDQPDAPPGQPDAPPDQPDAAQIDGCTAAPGSMQFDFTNTIQTFTVPPCVTLLTIDTFGAQGGDTTSSPVAGGLGARMSGDFTVAPGMTLAILVGEQGQTATFVGGGGGGSFVWNDAMPGNAMIAAGGGGGGGYPNTNPAAPGAPGVTTIDGGLGVGATDGNGIAGGGATTPSAVNWSGGGAGWIGDGNGAGGSGIVGCPVATGGLRPSSGAAGGNGGCNPATSCGRGGYGGGGGAQGRCDAVAGGGGGGYSGGGAGVELVAGGTFNGGGGGGSFNAGVDQNNSDAANAGNGRVVITW